MAMHVSSSPFSPAMIKVVIKYCYDCPECIYLNAGIELTDTRPSLISNDFKDRCDTHFYGLSLLMLIMVTSQDM